MILDLKHIFVNEDSVLPIEYSLDLSDVEFSGTYPLKKPITVNGIISNKASIVTLNAEVTYLFEAPCDRCGVDFTRKHTLSLLKTLASSLEGDDNEEILLIPDMKLDLDDLIYTETVLSLPMKHLCKDDCKGLCGKCGKNLNDGECGCPKKEIDPRLAALADLLNK